VLAPLAILAAAGAGVWVVRVHPGWLAGAVLSALVGAGLVWVVVSTFWPAKADHVCPRCGAEALARRDPDTTRGVSCGACGHEDPEATAWFLAEEQEEPLESVVLEERRRRRASRSRSGA